MKGGDTTVRYNTYRQLIQQNYTVFVTPYGTQAALDLYAHVPELANYTVIVEGSGYALIANPSQYSPGGFFWCITPTAYNNFIPAIDLWQILGIQTIRPFQNQTDAASTSSMSGVRNRAPALGMNILLDLDVSTSCASSALILTLMQQATILKPDGVIISGPPPDVLVFISAMSASRLSPKVAGSTIQISSLPAYLLAAIFGGVQ